MARYKKFSHRDAAAAIAQVERPEDESKKGRQQHMKLVQKREAFKAVFSKVNSAIARREVKVNFTKPSQWSFQSPGGRVDEAPGWTDGETVFLSANHFNKIMLNAIKANNMASAVDALVKIKGLNYHELSHVLFTPRNTFKPTKQILKDSKKHGHHIFHAYNILEDQRIESMFVGRWPVAKHFFTLMVSEFITSRQDGSAKPSYISDSEKRTSEATLHLLLHGRRYLNVATRTAARDLFINQHGADEASKLETLIDEYRLLTFPVDADRGIEIVHEFAKWLLQAGGDNGQSAVQFCPNTSIGHEHHREGGAANTATQREVLKRMEVLEDGDKKKEDAKAAATPSPVTQEPQEAQEPQDQDAPASDGNDSSGSGEAITDDQTLSDEMAEALANSVADAAAEALSHASQDVLQTLKAIRDYEDCLLDGDTANYSAKQELPASQVAKVASSSLAISLEQLRNDAEPSWVKKVASGRINVPAMMANRHVDLDVFDQWTDSGDDATSIEVVVLLDQSVSMRRTMREASMALWAIKSACDRVEVPCTVIGYSDGMAVLYRGDETVGGKVPIFPVIANTNPSRALEAAQRVFTTSAKRFKLLFTITDGEWQTNVAPRIVKEINTLGVQSHLLYLCPKEAWKSDKEHSDTKTYVRSSLAKANWHNHQHGAISDSPRELAQHIQKEMVHLVQEATATLV